MGLRKKKAPKIRAEIQETGWLGDEALDRPASDITQWTKTADMEYLKPLPGEKLSVIRWRPLEEWELGSLSFSDESEQAFVSRCYEAARIGLVSIEGVDLQRTRQASVSRITDDCFRELCEFREDLPVSLLVPLVTAASRGIDGEEATKLFDAVPADLRETSLPLWVGGHILAATFRSFKRDS